MYRNTKWYIGFIAIVLLIALCAGCSNSISNVMPDKETVDEFITNHSEDIQNVTNYLLELRHEYASIDSSDGKIFVDIEYKYIDIKDSEIKTSISNLWKAGCRTITKSLQYNSIQFLLWRNNFKEIDCGFVYPIYDSRDPSVNYQTELSPISNNCYYYISDYGEWRLLH